MPVNWNGKASGAAATAALPARIRGVARGLPTLDLESFASKFAQSSVRLRGSRSRRALGRCRARRIPPGDALLAIRGGRYGPKGFDALWISGDATELVGDALEEVSPS